MQSFGDFFDDWVFFKWQLTNHSPNLIIKTHIHPVNVGQIPPAPTALWQKMGQRHNKKRQLRANNQAQHTPFDDDKVMTTKNHF